MTGPSDGGIRCKEVGVSGEANPPGQAEIRCRRGLRTPSRDRNQTAEKSFAGEGYGATVPQTDTGGRGEKPQALE